MTRVILYDFKAERSADQYYPRYEGILNKNEIFR